jgi:hypothetical protein
MNLPDYHFLSAPLWLITVLQILVVTLHFAAMNLVVGGLVFVIVSRILDRHDLPVVRLWVKLAPTAMAGTITLGVAALLFLQVVFPGQFYSASIVSGWFWLLVIAAAIGAYYLLYLGAFHPAGSVHSKWIWLGLTLLCFLYISFVYSSTFSLLERPELCRELYRRVQSGWVLNSDLTSYLIRWLHMLSGASMVGGFWIGWLGRNDDRSFALAKWYTLAGMLLAFLFGMLYLVVLGPMIPALMRSPAAWNLTLSILLSLGALHLFFKKKFGLAGLSLFVSLAGMVLVRHDLRLIMLKGQYDPASLQISPQWSVVTLFICSFLLAIGLLVYMLRLFFSVQIGKGSER